MFLVYLQTRYERNDMKTIEWYTSEGFPVVRGTNAAATVNTEDIDCRDDTHY